MDARPPERSAPEEASPPPSAGVGWRASLSTRLLGATFAFVFLATCLVFLPWLSEVRLNWMRVRINLAQIVTVAFSDLEEIPPQVQEDLLRRTGAEAIAVRTGSMRRLIAARPEPHDVAATFNLAETDTLGAMGSSLKVLFSSGPRAMRLIGEPGPDGTFIDMVVDEEALRNAMWRFVQRVALASAAIAAVAGLLVFYLLQRTLLRPLNQLGRAMAAFRADPENPALILQPSARGDEIGAAERHLAAMQVDLAKMLKERAHLADLGTAVSKINHDLRNILGSAQIFTDRLSTIPDKTAQRFGPKLLATLDRAIGYSQAVLDYGKVREAPPQRRLVAVRRLAEDVADIMGLTQHPTIDFVLNISGDTEVDADPDQMFRVLMNLMRNAIQAVETDPDPSVVRRISVSARRDGPLVTLKVADTGPGVPPRARAKLFRPFEGGIRAGGTGLGLAICAELVRAHGGSITLVSDGPGATFLLQIPDRAAVGQIVGETERV